MVDRWEITYDTGEREQDPETGDEVPVRAVRFTSKGRLQSRSVASELVAGGADIDVTKLELQLPYDCTQPHADDIAECLKVGRDSDSRMLGMKVRIIAPVNKTFATATRLAVEGA